ncbi:VanZ family protein [Metabacillus herbersteinensis]|uniref:VanZ family protein n=1 Tax=Metabacillus herbersteinensis TaxID=283816 RepID=A0ABV6GFN3_9BACI
MLQKSVFKVILTSLPIVYILFVWVLSSLPADAILDTSFSFDSLLKESLHLIEFAILYWLLAFSFASNRKWDEKMSIVAAVISISYGAIDEIHQYFVPYRSATVIDFVKDTIGVLVSYYIVRKTYFAMREGSIVTRVFRRIEEKN